MNKSIPQTESTGIDYSLKTKIRHKTKNVNATHLQCQCQYTPASLPSPYIFDIYLFCRTLKKNWLRELRTIPLPVCFMVLNFDYGIQLSIIQCVGVIAL